MDDINKLKEVFTERLTDSQEIAVDKIQHFLDNDVKCFILKGYAGTGKTFLINGIVTYLEAMGVKFFLMAPTGRAAQVLSKKTKLRSTTIHRSIYQLDSGTEFRSEESPGRDKWKIYFDVKDNDVTGAVYIIDEASMISSAYSEAEMIRFGSGYLLKDLLEFVNIDKNKIIFVGDPAQLPPVGSDISPALSTIYFEEKYMLYSEDYEMTDVIRQEEKSGILKNATNLRNNIRDDYFYDFTMKINGRDVVEIERRDFIDKYIDVTDGEIDYDTAVLAYTNKQVRQYNDLIRNRLFPGRRDIKEGEKVLLVHNSYNYEIDLFNGDFGEVVYAADEVESRMVTVPTEQTRIQVPLHYRDMVIRFWDLGGEEHDIECKILDSVLHSDKRDVSYDELRAVYFDFRNRYSAVKPGSMDEFLLMQKDPYFNCLRVKYGYAVTCHKAQGGEWANVFIDLYSPMGYSRKSYFRWAYTALTRAEMQVFIMNRPFRNVDYEREEVEDFEEREFVPEKLSPQARDKDLPFELDKQNEAAKLIYGIVNDIVKNRNIKIDKIIHFPYCERYFFLSGGEKVWANFWYDEKSKVTLVDYQPDADTEIKNVLISLFQSITGNKLVRKDR